VLVVASPLKGHKFVCFKYPRNTSK